MTMIINDTNDETLSVLAAMRSQEDEVSACYNYLQNSETEIDYTCRKSMVTWCQQVQKALKLSPETVWIAISFFDRYLSSGKGKSSAALQDKYTFQLTVITCFYTAVKLYEDVELSVSTLAKLCKNYYKKNDIIESEEDILFALDFRLATPTAMDFIRHYMKLLPSEMITSSVMKACEEKVAYTSTDIYFTFCKPSVVGASCLASVLIGKDLLSSKQRQNFYLHLANTSDLIDIMEAQNKLVTGHTKPVTVSKLTQTSSSTASVISHTSTNYLSAVSQTSSSITPSIVSKVMQHQKRMAKLSITSASSMVGAVIDSPVCITHAPRMA